MADENTREVIRAEGLTYVYPNGTQALDDLSLQVQEGEALALLGPNGSGKTTFIRLLAGVLTPTEGAVHVFGHPPEQLPGALKNDWAFQFQDRPGLYPELAVSEHIALFSGYYDRAMAAAKLRELALLEAIWRKRVGVLSWGQRRRVELALALLPRPKLLVLDEPTAGLDIEAKERIWELLERLRDQGMTLFLTSHDPSEVARLADRVAFLKEGALVFTGTLDAFVRETGSVHQAYLAWVGGEG